MTTAYKISAPLFNAVLSAQGGPETRRYLQGFFLCCTHKELVATDGYLLCKAAVSMEPDGEPDGEPDPDQHQGGVRGWLFQRIEKPIPKSVDHVIIRPDADPKCRLELVGGRWEKFRNLERSSFMFPNYPGFINNAQASNSKLAYNPEYLYRPFRWAHVLPHNCSVRITDGKVLGPARVKAGPPLADLGMYLMNVRT